MQELKLKYGLNPNQANARVYAANGDLPFQVLNGAPGYINMMDALNAWQLVSELAELFKMPAATSFKHVSPAGAAIATMPSDDVAASVFIEQGMSPQAIAYAKARGADRVSSYGDFIALSDTCDISTANFIAKEVSDGIIAPAYDEDALAVLKGKKQGKYVVLQMDKSYKPEPIQTNMLYGIRFEQNRNDLAIDANMLSNVVTKAALPQSAMDDLMLAMITLKYTQSNSVALAKDGMAIGIGAGQQSRIHCTRLASQKADTFNLRHSPQILSLPFKSDIRGFVRDNLIDTIINYQDMYNENEWEQYFTSKPQLITPEQKADFIKQQSGISIASDAFFPFGDNIERAYVSGVRYVSQPGGSLRDADVIAKCDELGMAMCFTGMRLFLH